MPSIAPAATAAPAITSATAAPSLAAAPPLSSVVKSGCTMEDPAALERQRGWSELVEHLADIPPARRDATWAGLAERASIALLTTLATDKERFVAVTAADDLTKRYPTLTSSNAFMKKRAEVA
jgi:hypothetical protein